MNSQVGSRPADFESEVGAFRPAERLKPFPKSNHVGLSHRVGLGKRSHHADPPHRFGLLRARRERPRRCRAGDERYEPAPLHSITSSARASSVGGTVRWSAFAVLRLSADFCQTLDACHIFSSRPAQ